VNNLEATHRYFAKKLNATLGLSLQYYRDAEIDTSILPLVELLNSQWTLTAHSCGGHWKPSMGKPDLPYITFFVLPDKGSAWERIWGRCRNGLALHVNEKATIAVVETLKLPHRFRDWMGWYFEPAAGRREVAALFSNEREFRNTYARMTCDACRVVRNAMSYERKRKSRRQAIMRAGTGIGEYQ